VFWGVAGWRDKRCLSSCMIDMTVILRSTLMLLNFRLLRLAQQYEQIVIRNNLFVNSRFENSYYRYP
jgi:hypothetical protein